jgi:uncharacterized membrane protein YoaK (UPF0700 family)
VDIVILMLGSNDMKRTFHATDSRRQWLRSAYLMIPITAYFAGAFFSEYLGKSVKKLHLLRWDTILIGIEVIVVMVLGFLPASVPDQICQIALNFICSM